MEKIPNAIKDGLKNHKNITQLYKHQADALEKALNGENIIICTSTSR